LPAVAAHAGGARQGVRGWFHHALEALVIKGAFLAGVRTQLLQVIGLMPASSHCWEGVGAFVWVVSHREVERVGRDEWVAGAGQMRVHTRPWRRVPG
jgi:hypothetical protein